MELFIIIVVLIGIYFGGFMLRHLNSTIMKNHQYYVDIIKIREGESIKFGENLDKSGLPIIKMKVEGIWCNFLLDTGANINMIDKRFVEVLKSKNNSHVFEECNVFIHGASGKDMCSQKAKFSIICNSKSFVEEFLISDSVEHTFDAIFDQYNIKLIGVLGNKFFKEHEMSLDFKRKIIWMQ